MNLRVSVHPGIAKTSIRVFKRIACGHVLICTLDNNYLFLDPESGLRDCHV